MAAGFNGTNQFLTAPLSFPGYPFTFNCKASFNSLLTNPYLVAFDTPISGNIRRMALRVTTTGIARAGVYNDAGTVFAEADSPAAAIAINTPYTLTAVFTSSASRSLFVNATKYTNTTSLTISAPTRFIIGAAWLNTVNSLFHNGSIAEAAVWNNALSDDDVASLAAGYTPDQVRPQSLQFYAPLIRTFQDLRGGLAISNVNGATVATHPRVIT